MKILQFICRSLMMLLGLLTIFSCAKMTISDDVARFDPEGDLPIYSVTLSGPGQAAGERMVDIGNGNLYTLPQGTESPQLIDFVILWSSNSGMNLVSPIHMDRLKGWNAGKTMNEEWLVKNQTTFLKLDASEESQAIYNAVKSVKDVKEAYEQAKQIIEADEELLAEEYGPTPSLRYLSEGDILFIKTAKDVYAVAKILGIKTGTSGSLDVAFKIDRSEEKKIPAISEEEKLETYDVLLDRPGYLNGQRFWDVTTGETYSTSSATPQNQHPFYNQEKIDIIFLNSATRGYFNLLTPDEEIRLPLWTSGADVYNDWLVKNDGEFIKLSASDASDSIFLNTYTKTALHESYSHVKEILADQSEYEKDIHGEGKYISEVSSGDLIFFKSKSKNVLTMMQVTAHTSGGAGKLELSVRVDNNEKQEVERHPNALNYGQIKIGGWSALGPEGDTYHVDLASITQHTPGTADENQENIDLLNLWSGAGFVNFMTPTSGSVTAWGSSKRIADWTQRNEGTFMRIENPTTEEEEEFDELVNRDLLVQAYENAEANIESRPDYNNENHGPSIRIRYLQAGDLVYFKSNEPDRNLYAAIKIIDVTPGSSNGRETVEIMVKSNLKNE